MNIAFALLALAAAPQASPRTGQEIGDGVVVDYDYGFELRAPDKAWTLLDRDGARSINPLAAAGLIRGTPNIYTLVIPEEAPGVSLEDYFAANIEQMDLADKKLSVPRREPIHGYDAIHFEVRGKKDRLELVYFGAVMKRGDFFYLLLSWYASSLESARPDQVWPIADSFFPRDDIQPSHPPPAPPKDMTGLGWRVKDGVYENALYGFRFELPSPEWRFLSAEELANDYENAAMGVIHERSQLNLLAMVEDIGDTPPKAFEQHLLAELSAQWDKSPDLGSQSFSGERWTRAVFREISVNRLTYDNTQYLTARGKRSVRLMATWLSASRARAEPLANQALQRFAFLEGPGAGALRRELLAAANRAQLVSRDAYYRDRVFQHFPANIRLALPEGFWQVSLESRPGNPMIFQFVNEEPNLFGAVIYEKRDIPLADYHRLVAERVGASADEAAARRLIVNGAPAYQAVLTRPSGPSGGPMMRLELTAFAAGEKKMTLLLSAVESVFETTADLRLAVVNSVRFRPSSLSRASAAASGAMTDRLFGLTVAPPPGAGWTLKEDTPEELRGFLSVFSLENADKARGSLHYMALQTKIGEGHIENQVLARTRGRGLELEQLETGEAEWLGRKARHLIYRGVGDGLQEMVELFVVKEGPVTYALLAAAPKRLEDRGFLDYAKIE